MMSVVKESKTEAKFVHKGAIRRLYFENFVTYSKVEILPEPGLNVVIGPNGTGKSTIVCGICLGLGGSPKILGRQNTIPEFIKHGESQAIIEVDLHNPDGASFRIRREITRDASNHSRWYLNGRLSTVKSVESFVNSLGIQINNLTQFLPQDRVSDFARMSSKELLAGTEKAINMQLYDDHQYLKTAWDTLKEYETKLSQASEKLITEKSTNAQLEQDVKTFKLREQHVSDLKILKMKRPWLLYDEQRIHYQLAKAAKDKLQIEYQAARDTLAPLRQQHATVTKTEQALARELKSMQEKSEANFTLAEKMRRKIENTKTKVEEVLDELKKKQDDESKRCQNVKDIQMHIRVLQDDLGNADDHADLQPTIDEVTKQLQNIGRDMSQLQQQIDSNRRDISDLRREEQGARRDLQKLQDVNLQRLEDLRRFHEDTYKAVLWLRSNHARFKGVIHEPMMLTIKMHDPRHAKYLENTVSNNDMKAFICEHPEDVKLFLRIMREDLHYRVNVFGTVNQDSDSYRPQYPIERYKKYGFFSYLRELFTAPEPVMRYLCAQNRIHTIPIGNQHTKDNVSNVINTWNELKMFFTENDRITIKTSRYTGNKATTTSVLRESKVLARTTVDTAYEKNLNDRLQKVTKNISAKEDEMRKLMAKVKECERKEEELRTKKKKVPTATLR